MAKINKKTKKKEKLNNDPELKSKIESKVEMNKELSVIDQILKSNDNQVKKKLQKKMSKMRLKQLKIANVEEEKLIKKLEKKLRIDKHKSKTTVPSIFNDGLDYALELCLPNKGDDDDNDDTSDEDVKTKHNKKKRKTDLNPKESLKDKNPKKKKENLDDEEFEDDEEADNLKICNDKVESTDIYGRKRDVKGNLISENSVKYCPPHLKNNQNKDISDKVQKIKKQLKGFLNRMSEANMHKISKSIDQMYMENSRHDMNNTLISLVLEAIVASVLTSDRLILEHILLITVLHANVGSEIGALFLQTVVNKFHELSLKISEENVENKELDNIVLIICHLYTFKIIQEQLLYEIIDHLSTTFLEKNLECILLILRSVGFTLRKDNPALFKKLIMNLQTKATDSTVDNNNNFRIKYMLETLLAIKNNNVNKIPQYDSTLSEHLRKISKSLVNNGKFVTTLNITLDDLLNAEENGKWWIVGSAWVGKTLQSTNSDKEKNDELYNDKLLNLCKQQHMNTDNKKKVFCILMNAEDYLDAFEKLIRLNIKENNAVTSVIVHCSLAEKKYNPYYSILAQKFCELDRSYQLSMQFVCWDKINDLNTFTPTKINNFANMLIYLLQNEGLNLSILKIVDFSDLKKITLRFLKIVFVGLLLGDKISFEKVFKKIATNTKLNSFKDSLRLFLNHFVINKNIVKENSESMDILVLRVQYVNDLYMSYK